jgi:hypothetical protein
MGPVPRADNLTRFHFRIIQGFAVMCATVFYRVELSTAAYDEEGKSVDLRRKRFQILERVGGADVNPVRAQNIPV